LLLLPGFGRPVRVSGRIFGVQDPQKQRKKAKIIQCSFGVHALFMPRSGILEVHILFIAFRIGPHHGNCQ
jgi:hypothetical protein